MNDKITLAQLTRALSRMTSESEAASETFIKHLLDLIVDTLAKGESITIKGIGSFTPSAELDEGVMWIPAKELAEAINEPFAFFEAVELGEGVTESTLSENDEETATPIEEEAEERLPEEPVAEPEPHVEIPPIPETTQPAIVTPPIPPAIPVIEKSEPQQEETSEDQPIEQDYAVEPEEGSRRFSPWLSLAIGVIAGLVIGYYAGYYAHWYPFSKSGVRLTDDAPSIEAVIAPTDSVAAADIQPVEPSVETDTIATYRPIAVDTVTTTRYLTTMARKYYGDYKFWVYIYEENSDIITDPNRISPGTAVTIPAPEKYSIDSSDPESVKRAEKKIGEISSRLAK